MVVLVGPYVISKHSFLVKVLVVFYFVGGVDYPDFVSLWARYDYTVVVVGEGVVFYIY
jgi:hypothetical protein